MLNYADDRSGVSEAPKVHIEDQVIEEFNDQLLVGQFFQSHVNFNENFIIQSSTK